MPEDSPVRSPCVTICALDDQDICIGCYRSVREIAVWSQASDEQKRAIVEHAEARYRAAWPA